MISFADVLADPDMATVATRLRPEPGSYVAGRWVPGPLVPTEIVAIVQPATGEDLQVLEEGLRSLKAVKVITEADLRTGDAPDEVIIDGETYVVRHVTDWSRIAGWRRAVCTRRPS